MKRLVAFIVMLSIASPAFAGMGRNIVKSATSQTTYIRIVDAADGTPETGVTSATSGIDLEYVRLGAAPVDLTESTLGSTSAAYSAGGIIHVGGGVYRVDLPDAAVLTGVDQVSVQGTITDMVVLGVSHQLVAASLSSATFGTDAGLFLNETWEEWIEDAPELSEELEEALEGLDIDGVTDFTEDQQAQILAALSVNGDIEVPKALIWTITRKDGVIGSRTPIVIDPEEEVDVAAKFNNVLALGDAIDAIVSVELVGGDEGSVESPAFEDEDDAEIWMSSAVKFQLTGGTSGELDQIKVKVHTVQGHTITGNVYALPNSAPTP